MFKPESLKYGWTAKLFRLQLCYKVPFRTKTLRKVMTLTILHQSIK